jgi:CHAD domain-containing protein
LCGDSLDHLSGALKKAWKRYRKQLERCQEEFSKEAIHPSRVATRRLLAILELLRGFLPPERVKKLACALKEHLDSFDDLRDTQVQLELVSKMKRKFAAARKFYAHLARLEERFGRRTRKRIRKVKTGKLGKLVQQSLRDVESHCRVCEPAIANERLLRAVNDAFVRTKRLRSQIDPRNTKTIHRTRVAFKRFRYMVEALAGCLPFANERRLEAMHVYQGLMGDIQDAQVLLTAADKYLCKHHMEPAAAVRFREELLQRREVLIRRYLETANKLLHFWPG